MAYFVGTQSKRTHAAVFDVSMRAELIKAAFDVFLPTIYTTYLYLPTSYT
jgi:hypothetical protein